MLAGLLPKFDDMFVEKAIPIEKLKPEGFFFKKYCEKGDEAILNKILKQFV